MSAHDVKARTRRMLARWHEWYTCPPEKMQEFLGLLPWQRSEVLDDFAGYLQHSRNLLWAYTIGIDRIRGLTKDPKIQFEADFALAMDNLRDPVHGEARLREMRRLAWRGVLAKRDPKEEGKQSPPQDSRVN